MNNVIYPKQFHARTTSASKSFWQPRALQTTPAVRKREILISVGWSEYDDHGMIKYSNPHVCDNGGMFLDDAWKAQIMREYAGRYFAP